MWVGALLVNLQRPEWSYNATFFYLVLISALLCNYERNNIIRPITERKLQLTSCIICRMIHAGTPAWRSCRDPCMALWIDKECRSSTERMNVRPVLLDPLRHIKVNQMMRMGESKSSILGCYPDCGEQDVTSRPMDKLGHNSRAVFVSAITVRTTQIA